MEVARALSSSNMEASGWRPDPAYASMSKRQQKRYRKKVLADLNAQLRDAKASGRDARAEVKRMEAAQRATASEVARRMKDKAKEMAKTTGEQKRRRAKANNTVDAIGYTRLFENGIAEVEEGFYSETLSFEDITYQSAREETQYSIMGALSDIYNYLPPDVTAQISVINTPAREDELADRMFYDPEAQSSDALREDAEVMNEILRAKLDEGVSNIRRRRYLTIGVPERDPEGALRRLSRINTDLSSSFQQIGCPLTPLRGVERLEVMNSLMRPGTKLDFSYDKLRPLSMESTKDYIAPNVLDFKPNGATSFFKSDGKLCQVLVMRNLDSPLDDTAIARLVDLQMPICVTWYLQAYEKSDSINQVKVTRAWIDKEIIEEQKKAVQQGYDYSILPSEVQYSRDETEDLLAKLQGQQQHLFNWTGLIYTWADDEDALLEQVYQIIDVASSAGITVELLEYRQRQGMNSILPLGLCHIDMKRPLLTSEACIMVPFATQELDQAGGNWYYQNQASNNLVFGNRALLASPVGFISGKTGSGKGFFAKNEIEGTLLSKPNDQIIIFDRAGEYRLLVEHASGTYATFGTGRDAHMNPLGMAGLEHQDFGSQVAFKADAMIAQAAAAAAETRMGLSEEERSIIQRCVETVFRRWRDAGPGASEPILEDYYDELRRQPEPIAQDIALRYERFVRGYSDYFNHPTDIDLDARIIGLNFKEVQDSMLVFALIAFCETVRFIMYRNFEQGRRTWLYIEEMESLFKYPSVLNYFRRFANECRKFGMYLTGITQSTESMIRNPDANAIVKNSDFIMLLQQSKEDRDYWASALGLSPAEISCIDSSAKVGWGLLVFGANRIAIKGEFPRDNHIYDLFSTNPNEWEERRARGLTEAGEQAPDGTSFRRRGKRVRGRKKKGGAAQTGQGGTR